MSTLVMRGLIAGLLASFLAFGFAKIIGEPQVDRAIAFEEQEAAAAHSHNEAEEELVSRDVQASYGLFVGVATYGTALGGLFALAYAFAGGRLLSARPRTLALTLAVIGFGVFYLVPFIKYPANPPSVGVGETIGYRTQLYFAMIVFSGAALAIAVAGSRMLAAKLGSWNAALAGIAIYGGLAGLAVYMLPGINEVPTAFPADLLWQFRIAAFGTQAILWGAIGLLFGSLVERERGELTAR